jgi:transcriptional regulator with XRE-family HTH domain
LYRGGTKSFRKHRGEEVRGGSHIVFDILGVMYGAVVRHARTARGLTQRDLAGISGIQQSNISAVENERRMPTVETLHRLLAACGYELVATAGPRVLAFPPVGVDPDELPETPAEAPSITADTPMAVRVRAINAVLDLAETIVRSR